MRVRRPFLKQKPILYFDENFPAAVVSHFGSASYWRKKIRVTSAGEDKTLQRSDDFHYGYCRNKGYTLVTLDTDFDNDSLYPFTSGSMAGIIMIRASSSQVRQIVDILSRLLEFVTGLPLPKAFLLETKFVAGRTDVTMRGRDAATREIKTLHVRAGLTTIREIRQFFSY